MAQLPFDGDPHKQKLQKPYSNLKTSACKKTLCGNVEVNFGKFGSK